MRAPAIFQAVLIFAAISAFCGGVSAAPGEVLHVQKRNVYLRPAPSTHSGVLMRLRRGQAVTELERRDGWVRVATFDVISEEGWIQGVFVSAEAPGPENPKTAEIAQTRPEKAKSVRYKPAPVRAVRIWIPKQGFTDFASPARLGSGRSVPIVPPLSGRMVPPLAGNR